MNDLTQIRQLVQEAQFGLSAEDIFQLMCQSWRFFRGRTFEDSIDLIEDVTGESLTHLRSDKCPLCGSSINLIRTCSNMCCENQRKELTPEECVKTKSDLLQKSGKEFDNSSFSH